MDHAVALDSESASPTSTYDQWLPTNLWTEQGSWKVLDARLDYVRGIQSLA